MILSYAHGIMTRVICQADYFYFEKWVTPSVSISLACTRYVELNPIRAGMVKNPQAWRWSSADAHPRRKDDILVRTKPLLAMIKSPWKKFLSVGIHESEMDLFRKHERTGRPIGDDAFIERLERLLDRPLKPKKPGPKVIDK
jgi:putative transposase